ncbi:MAG: SLC13 family permease, partial [Gammaproteobacteria bacterium]|nr:SLC13 family permease [Gammaproteobacteria bacterium]
MTEPLALTTEMIAVMAILGLALYLFAFDVVRVDVAAVLIMVLLGLTSLVPGYPGLIPPTDLFNGFASNAVISIIAVMIIGAGLDKTGVMNQVAARILQYAGRTESRIIAALSGTVAAISSFMQNVGAAALFLPVAARISKRVDLPLSRLLMPMGFCAILGGTLTMIGSSPLILLNDLILSSNRSLPSGAETMQTFDMFAVTPVGIALVAAGVGYFVVFGHWVLPTVTGKAAESGSTLQYFENLYGIEGVVYELRVTADSPLAGGTLGDVEGKGRAGWIIAIRNGQKIYVEPAGNTEIRTGSELAVMGSPKAVEEFARQFALEIKPEMESFAETLSASSAG